MFRALGESHRQLARRQLRLLQSQLDDLAPDLLGDAVPDAPRRGRTVAHSLRPAGSVKIVPVSLYRDQGGRRVPRKDGAQPSLADRLHLPEGHRVGWYYLSTV